MGLPDLEVAVVGLHRLDVADPLGEVVIRRRPGAGQRKRLALVNAWPEERPVLVFDEWAADQDPALRKIFYTELLADLKRLGKTIIVISHDDRYFNIADPVVRLRAGKWCTKWSRFEKVFRFLQVRTSY